MRCGVRTRSGLPGCQGKRSLRAPEGSGAWIGGCAYGVPVYAGGGQGRSAFVPAGPARPARAACRGMRLLRTSPSPARSMTACISLSKPTPPRPSRQHLPSSAACIHCWEPPTPNTLLQLPPCGRALRSRVRAKYAVICPISRCLRCPGMRVSCAVDDGGGVQRSRCRWRIGRLRG